VGSIIRAGDADIALRCLRPRRRREAAGGRWYTVDSKREKETKRSSESLTVDS
jgi:hypothetical protein